MVKIQCKTCKDVKFSAATDNLNCPCGGRFQIIPTTQEEQVTRIDETTKRLFSFSNILKHDENQQFN